MNQSTTGKLISRKRKEKNLTQEQLAEKLGVSNKTISKWETGKCMPDYSVIKSLCEELDITIIELIDGEEAKEKNLCSHNDEQIMDLLRRIQDLKKQKNVLFGILLILLGIIVQILSHTLGGADGKTLLSQILWSLSIAGMLLGACVLGGNILG